MHHLPALGLAEVVTSSIPGLLAHTPLFRDRPCRGCRWLNPWLACSYTSFRDRLCRGCQWFACSCRMFVPQWALQRLFLAQTLAHLLIHDRSAIGFAEVVTSSNLARLLIHHCCAIGFAEVVFGSNPGYFCDRRRSGCHWLHVHCSTIGLAQVVIGSNLGFSTGIACRCPRWLLKRTAARASSLSWGRPQQQQQQQQSDDDAQR